MTLIKLISLLKKLMEKFLLVSQFTLLANISKGNRPSFIDAEEPNIANKVIKYVAQELSQYGNVKEGIFGEDMNVSIDNDGPITIILESKNGKLKS